MPKAQKRVQVQEDLEADDEVPMPPKDAKVAKPKKKVCVKTLHNNLKEALDELEKLRNPPQLTAEYIDMIEKLEFFRKVRDKLDEEFQEFIMRCERIWDPFTIDTLKSKLHLIGRQ